MAIGGSGIESVLGGRADALAMNPRAQQEAMQKGRQDVRRGEVPGNLLDLLAMQKLADDKQRAKAEMDASMQGNPATIKDQLEQQLMQSTKEDVARQVGGALNQRQAQTQKRMSEIANPPAPAPNLLTGVARAPAPNMARMAGGGIVAFANGGDTGAGAVEEPDNTRMGADLRALLGRIGLDEGQFYRLRPEAREQILNMLTQARAESGTPYERERRASRAPGKLSDILMAESVAAKPGDTIDMRRKYYTGAPEDYERARSMRESGIAQAKALNEAAYKAGTSPFTMPAIPGPLQQLPSAGGQAGIQSLATSAAPSGPPPNAQPSGPPQGIVATTDPRMSAPQVSVPKGPSIDSIVQNPNRIEYKDPYTLPEAYDINRERDRLYRANLREYERDPMAEMRGGRKDAAEFLRREKVREAAMQDIEALKALDERQAKERGGISALSRYLLRSPGQSTAWGRIGQSIIRGQESGQQDERNRLLQLQKMRRDAEESDRLRADRAAEIGEGIRKTGEEAKRAGLTSATGIASQFATELSERAKGMLEADKANLTAETATRRDRMQFILGREQTQSKVDIANLEASLAAVRNDIEAGKVDAMNTTNKMQLLQKVNADSADLESKYAKLAAEEIAALEYKPEYTKLNATDREKMKAAIRKRVADAAKQARRDNDKLAKDLKATLATAFTVQPTKK